MNHPSRLLAVCLILLSAAVLTAQEKPVVQVDPMVNLSGQSRLDSLCGAIEESMRLTLRLMGRFDVDEEPVAAAPSLVTADLDTLHSRATAEGCDNLIFGSCTTEGESYLITVNAYDLATNQITYSETTSIGSLLDTFGAVDRITLAMVEGFSGIRVVFGGLRLLPLESGEPYEFTIDGVALGSPGGTLEGVPAGEHTLEFIQERPLELFSAVRRVNVPEEDTIPVTPPIPRFTDGERRAIEDGLGALRRAVVSGRPVDTEPVAAMDELLASPFFAAYRTDFRQRFSSWRGKAEERATTAPEPIHLELPQSIPVPGGYLWLGVQDLPYRETLSTHLATEVELSRPVANHLPTRRTISVDGDPADWTGVPGIEDPTGDFDNTARFYQSGVDLTECRFAYDNEYLYLMIRTADSSYSHSRLGHKVHLYNGEAGLYFDYWLTENDPVWVGWDPTSSAAQDTTWSAMRSRVKVEYGEVFESAIPIRLLMTWPYFQPVLRLRVGTYNDGSSGQAQVDKIESSGNIALPVRQILTLSE